MNKTIMHSNFAEVTFGSYGNKTMDDVCKMAANLGYDGIEFRENPPKGPSEPSFNEYIAQIAAAKKKYGLSEILFGVSVRECANEDKIVRQNAINTTIEKVKLMNDVCGTTLCNSFSGAYWSPIKTTPDDAIEYHGSAAATKEDWELTVDAFQQIAKELEKIGVKFAFETHMHYIHDIPVSARKLVDMIDSPMVGINMDFGNTVYFTDHPSLDETIELYGDKLFYTHLKNSIPIPGTTQRMPSSLCDGEINHRIYLAKLKEIGFTGPVGIEACRGGDRTWFAQQDLVYCKSVMDSLE